MKRTTLLIYIPQPLLLDHRSLSHRPLRYGHSHRAIGFRLDLMYCSPACIMCIHTICAVPFG